jgi:RimJ/RimL family protein N-acetyltransferase
MGAGSNLGRPDPTTHDDGVAPLPIQTARLILRDFRASDLGAYCDLRTHPDFQRFYGPGEGSRERSVALLGEFMSWAKENPRLRFQLAIEEPNLGLVGSCGVRIKDEDRSQATFGCELGRQHWGCGYALEAGRALVEFAFSDLGVHRIQAETVAENRPALTLAQRLGMRIEKRQRDSQWSRERLRDTVTLGLLSSEWEM